MKPLTPEDVARMGLTLDAEVCTIRHVKRMRPHRHMTLPDPDLVVVPLDVAEAPTDPLNEAWLAVRAAVMRYGDLRGQEGFAAAVAEERAAAAPLDVERLQDEKRHQFEALERARVENERLRKAVLVEALAIDHLLRTEPHMGGETGYQTGPVSTLKAKQAVRRILDAVGARP
jgi:hypothetical protein